MIKRKFNPMDPEEELLKEEEDEIEEHYSEFQKIPEEDAFNLSHINQFSHHNNDHEDQHGYEQHTAPASLLETKPQQAEVAKKEIYTESPRSASSKLGLWAVIVTVAIILCGVFFVYFLNDRGNGINAISGTAVIQSDPIEWKVRPDDPGGKTMPFEDLSILNPSENNEILQQHVDQLLSSPMTSDEQQTQQQQPESAISDILENSDRVENSVDPSPPSEPEPQPILNLEDVLRQNQ